MKKRTILILLLCIMAMGIVFAGKVNISAQVSPFSVQVISASNGTFVSKYGYGGSISIGSEAVIAHAEGGDGAVGIGHGFQGDDGSLSLDLGADLLVSANGTDWDDFDGSTRKRYMKTK